MNPMKTGGMKALALLTLAGGMGIGGPRSPHDLANGVTPRKTKPWSVYNLTKSQRRGLTPAEIDELREKLWRAEQAPKEQHDETAD
jgi:hypothetical protein